MKKNLLFVMNNLTCGGAEKALISLLETIDYSLYNVDLFLFKHEGLFFNKIPEQVNLLNEPHEYRYFDMNMKQALIDCVKTARVKPAISRLCAGYIFKTEKNKVRCEQRVWKFISKSLSSINKEYDAAIGYLEKGPIYFVIDKIKAKIKIGFIHTDYERSGMDSDIDVKYFNNLSFIASVSEESVITLQRVFPMYKEKIVFVDNVLSSQIIKKLSLEEIYIDNSSITITSIGRLHSSKGFDIAVDACDILVKLGYEIKWYIVGEGEERNKLEYLIKNKCLDDRLILVGVKDNPYPYIEKCDIYVQTSLYEGRCLAVTEAKILHKPIVVTNFKAAKDQITDYKNGLICEMNSKSIANGIKKLIDDKELRKNLISNLLKESIESKNENNKLFELIEK